MPRVWETAIPRSNCCILMSSSPESRSLKNLERSPTFHYERPHDFFTIEPKPSSSLLESEEFRQRVAKFLSEEKNDLER